MHASPVSMANGASIPATSRVAPCRSPLLSRGDLFEEVLEVVDGLSHERRRKQVRVVLRSPEQSLPAIAQFNVEVPASATALYIHVRHAPSGRKRSDIGRDGQRYRKERMTAWVRLELQAVGNHTERDVIVRNGSQCDLPHLSEQRTNRWTAR